MKERNADQIIRVDGRGCFVEVTTGMLRKGKVVMNFCQYNTNTNKMERQIPFYLDVPTFLVFAKDVEFGKIKKLADDRKASGKTDYSPVWQATPAGTAKEKLAQQGKARNDGKDEARILQVGVSTKYDVTLEVLRGPGEKQSSGIIAPKFDYKNGFTNGTLERVQIPMPYQKLREICAITQAHIYAMLSAGWNVGAYEYNNKVVEMPTREEVAEQPAKKVVGLYNDMP